MMMIMVTVIGVTSKLDYLVYLNVGAIWLSPFYKSPMKDFGYDVADFRDVDPIFGTLQDFDELLEQAHKRGQIIISIARGGGGGRVCDITGL